MSPLIHMEIETVRAFVVNTTVQFDTMDNLINDTSKKVKTIPWEGKSRDEFMREFTTTISHLTAAIDQGRITVQRVQREADEWVSVDSSGSRNIASIGTVIAGLEGTFVSGVVDVFLTFSGVFYEAAFLKWWKTQSTEEKKAFLEEQLREIAKELGFSAPPLRIMDLEDSDSGDYRGYYDGSEIVLDIDNFNADNPWDLVNTVAHETRHAFQAHAVQVYEDTKIPPEGVSVQTVKSWQSNYVEGNYIDGKKDFEGYWKQPVEVDARQFGDDYSKKVLIQQPWKNTHH